MNDNKWWGYIHVNGNMRVKRYFDPRDIDDAHESDFVKQVISPFYAKDYNEAVEYVQTHRWD